MLAVVLVVRSSLIWLDWVVSLALIKEGLVVISLLQQFLRLMVWSVLVLMSVVFFQAEDGIRNLTGTGVQTCALPILRTVLVDDHRRALMIQVVCAAANEAVALLREVGDHRRNIGMTGKPGLHGVLVGGLHVDQMRWHQRAHVCGHQVIEQWTGDRWGQDQEREGCCDRCAANAAEGAHPERPRAPGRSAPAFGPRSVYCRFLIERVPDAGMQLRRSAARCQVPTDRGARLFEIMKQGAALGAVLNVPFNIGSRDRVDLGDRKSTRLNSSHSQISYAVFCLKK